jgi:hypothetical protein
MNPAALNQLRRAHWPGYPGEPHYGTFHGHQIQYFEAYTSMAPGQGGLILPLMWDEEEDDYVALLDVIQALEFVDPMFIHCCCVNERFWAIFDNYRQKWMAFWEFGLVRTCGLGGPLAPGGTSEESQIALINPTDLGLSAALEETVYSPFTNSDTAPGGSGMLVAYDPSMRKWIALGETDDD